MDNTSVTQSPSELRLSAQQVDEFFNAGWITAQSLFNADEVARMKACFDDLERMATGLESTGLHHGSHFVLGEKDQQKIIKRVVWAGGSQPYLLQIGADRRLTLPCSQLLGSDVLEQLLSQAHFKRPHDGVIFGWHQDIQHRDKGHGTWDDVNGTGSFVQTLIVLDEMTADSGPLLFMPGSCRWGRVDFGEHGYDDPDYIPHRPPQFHEEEAVTISAQPGDVLFFGPHTAHASFENTSQHYRRVLINGYACPGANHRLYPGDGAGRKLHVGTASRRE
jgi:ectoine hydroxylase-related dioxygenase (phytanoyl-CoA dioxygenase family)